MLAALLLVPLIAGLVAFVVRVHTWRRALWVGAALAFVLQGPGVLP